MNGNLLNFQPRRPGRWILFLPPATVAVALAAISVGETSGLPAEAYSSWPMILLWAPTVAAGVFALWRARLASRPFTLLLHIGLMLILAGGLTSHVFAREGTVHLREGETSAGDGIPFAMRLEKFEVSRYPGTSVHSGYRTVVSVGPQKQRLDIRLNETARHEGYEFIQQSFDSDGKGVVLKYACDTAGTAVTLVAYILTLAGAFGFFFERRSGMRVAIRKARMLRRAMTVCLAACSFACAYASAVPDSVRFAFMRMMVQEPEGRVAPLAALAADFTSTVSGGKTSADGLTAEELMMEFLFDFSTAKERDIVRVKSEEMRKLLGVKGKYASYADYMRGVMGGALDPDDEGLQARCGDDMARFETIDMLVSGELLRLFPVADGDGIRWCSPLSDIPESIATDEWLFIRKALGLLNEYMLTRDYGQAVALMRAIRERQGKASGIDISDLDVRLERFYARFGPAHGLMIFCLAAGLALFAVSISRRLSLRRGTRILLAAMPSAVLLSLASLLAVRWIISGHIPLTNGFETMQTMALLLLVLSAAESIRRSYTLSAMAMIAAGMALAVAAMSGAGNTIGTLMPVLSSPLLSLHVLTVAGAYALMMMMAVNGLAALCVRDSERREYMMWTGRAMLYPAVTLLLAGILIGAVWARVSWGAFWSWDPKETWALITLLVYSLPLHSAEMRSFATPQRFHLFSVLALLTVLITYFGVNYYLGGMHSYA